MEQYQVALSFAGENRGYVENVAVELENKGVSVFYDEFKEVELWGKNLYDYLHEIYSKKAKYTVIFISSFYRDKLWTNHERKSAQERAFNENRESILPARFDATEIPGIQQTIGYIDLNKKTPVEFAKMICQKIGFEPAETQQDFTPKYPKSYFANSTAFFHDRFTDAFPGERGISIYEDPKEIIDRLRILFSEPIFYSSDVEAINPFWWFRGLQNLHIQYFKVLDNKRVLIDRYEFLINTLAAVNMGAYYQSFIYLQTSPQEPSGLYEIDQDYIDEMKLKNGFYREEIGIHKNKDLITRDEFDDGGAVINDKIMHFDREDLELRIRYLTPYNLLIAPHNSPINNSHFDMESQDYLNKILVGKENIHNLAHRIMKLPKREMMRTSEF